MRRQARRYAKADAKAREGYLEGLQGTHRRTTKATRTSQSWPAAAPSTNQLNGVMDSMSGSVGDVRGSAGQPTPGQAAGPTFTAGQPDVAVLGERLDDADGPLAASA